MRQPATPDVGVLLWTGHGLVWTDLRVLFTHSLGPTLGPLVPTYHLLPTDHLLPTNHLLPTHHLLPTNHLVPTDHLLPTDHTLGLLVPSAAKSTLSSAATVGNRKLAGPSWTVAPIISRARSAAPGTAPGHNNSGLFIYPLLLLWWWGGGRTIPRQDSQRAARLVGRSP